MKSMTLGVAVAALSLAFAVPAHAQEDPLIAGDFVTVSMISVQDGHDLDYANHLAGMWRKGQDFAMKQGWISSYEILTNDYKRAGEPDVYLVVHFPRMADAAEAEKRDKAYRDFMQATEAQMQAASGERAKYRTQMGTMLLRGWKWRN